MKIFFIIILPTILFTCGKENDQIEQIAKITKSDDKYACNNQPYPYLCN